MCIMSPDFHSVWLSTTYFGPVQWYQKLFRYQRVWIDTAEPFLKQTYRNRCVIAASHGCLSLTVPIEHGSGRLPVRDIRVSDHGEWRRLHWNALRSAYGESPFFEFYADDLAPFFERRWTYLADFNECIMRKMCELIDPTFTIPLVTDQPSLADDFRTAIRPKHPEVDVGFTPRRYYQVFERKNGFLPNLSILDLLMNQGNESILYLRFEN